MWKDKKKDSQGYSWGGEPHPIRDMTVGLFLLFYGIPMLLVVGILLLAVFVKFLWLLPVLLIALALFVLFYRRYKR